MSGLAVLLKHSYHDVVASAQHAIVFGAVESVSYALFVQSDHYVSAWVPLLKLSVIHHKSAVTAA